MAKKTRKTSRPKWQGQPNDAIRLAAFRWFAAMIEAKAIQLYATDQATFTNVEAILRGCVIRLETVRPRPAMADDDCPPGYVMCGGECEPMCLANEN